MDVRIPPLLYTLREYNSLKATQLSGVNYPSGALLNGEWMTFGMRLKGTQTQKLGAFARDDLVQDLLAQYQQGGKQARVLSDHIQMALLANTERALFHRMLTPCRALAHAAGRYSGVGTQGASIFDVIESKLTELESV